MTPVVAAILVTALVGAALARAIGDYGRGSMIGLAILYGCGAVTFVLILLSLAHIRWSALSALLSLLAIATIASIFIRRRAATAWKAHAFDLGSLILLAAFTTYTALASPSEWDFWDNWGLKARVFLEHGGIDWRWLESRWNDFSHPDYPLLLPMNLAFPGLLGGTWNDRWLGLLFAAWALAALIIVRSLTASETPNWVSALATLAVAPTAMPLTIGTAEGVLIAMAGAALLFLRRAVRDDNSADWRHGALLLGLAANCKNEGLALIAASAIGIVAADHSRWRRIIRLWPAIAVATPWLLLRVVHALPTDIAAGDITSRLIDRLSYPGEILLALDQTLADRWVWIAIIATFIIVPGAASRERFIWVTTLTQLATYLAIYFVTPNELTWHIATSWQRLSRQVELPITVVCVMLLACRFSPTRDPLAATSSQSATT